MKPITGNEPTAKKLDEAIGLAGGGKSLAAVLLDEERRKNPKQFERDSSHDDPFHPLSGKELACVGERYNRHGRRVLLRVDDVTVCSVQPQWTDLAAPDPEIPQVEEAQPHVDEQVR